MPTPRTQAIIADGHALFVNAEGAKLSRRNFTDDETAIRLDIDQPVTLKRLADVARRFDVQDTVKVFDWRYYWPGTNKEITEAEMKKHFDGGLEGGYETRKKEYVYSVPENALTIFVEDEPVYCNDNGTIIGDPVALADSM